MSDDITITEKITEAAGDARSIPCALLVFPTRGVQQSNEESSSFDFWFHRNLNVALTRTLLAHNMELRSIATEKNSGVATQTLQSLSTAGHGTREVSNVNRLHSGSAERQFLIHDAALVKEYYAAVFPSHAAAMSARMYSASAFDTAYGLDAVKLLVAVSTDEPLKRGSAAYLLVGFAAVGAANVKESGNAKFDSLTRVKNRSGTPIQPNGVLNISERQQTNITISPLHADALSHVLTTGLQDGGNGSGGGDADAEHHFVDAVAAASTLTFWKHDGPIVDIKCLPTKPQKLTNETTIKWLNMGFAPNFARAFATKGAADAFHKTHNAEITKLCGSNVNLFDVVVPKDIS